MVGVCIVLVFEVVRISQQVEHSERGSFTVGSLLAENNRLGLPVGWQNGMRTRTPWVAAPKLPTATVVIGLYVSS